MTDASFSSADLGAPDRGPGISDKGSGPCPGRVEAVVFDMDGVLVDTEQAWHEVRRDFALENGGHWTDDDQRTVMGMNSHQWAVHMRDGCGVGLPPEQIYTEVVERLRERYETDLPIYPKVYETVTALAERLPLAVASSSPLELIQVVVDAAGLAGTFSVLVSSDEVAHGKPEPDVYLTACARLGVGPEVAVAVEDSTNGIRAAAAAGLAVVAVPNVVFPPEAAVMGSVSEVLGSISELTYEVVCRAR